MPTFHFTVQLHFNNFANRLENCFTGIISKMIIQQRNIGTFHHIIPNAAITFIRRNHKWMSPEHGAKLSWTHLFVHTASTSVGHLESPLYIPSLSPNFCMFLFVISALFLRSRLYYLKDRQGSLLVCVVDAEEEADHSSPYTGCDLSHSPEGDIYKPVTFYLATFECLS